MDSKLMEAIKAEAAKRQERRGVQEVGWDQNLQGLGRRFHKEYRYRMLSSLAGAGNQAEPEVMEGTEVVLQEGSDPRDCIRLRQTDDHIGTTVYTAAVQVSRYLERAYGAGKEREAAMAGQVVLELGSGTGLVGFVAAMLGAEVVLTDLEGPVLDNLRHNAKMLPKDVQERVSTVALKWGEPYSHPAHLPPVTMVLGVEVVYERQWVEPLVATLRQLLAATPAPTFLWSHDTRGRPGVPLFTELLSEFATLTPVPSAAFSPSYTCPHVKVFTCSHKA